MTRPIKILLAAASVAVVLSLWQAGQAIRARRAFLADRAALHAAFQDLTAEALVRDIGFHNISFPYTPSRREALVRALRAVPEEALVVDRFGGTYRSLLFLRTKDGEEYVLYDYANGLVGLIFDKETAARFGQRGWFIDDASLAAYFDGIFAG